MRYLHGCCTFAEHDLSAKNEHIVYCMGRGNKVFLRRESSKAFTAARVSGGYNAWFAGIQGCVANQTMRTVFWHTGSHGPARASQLGPLEAISMAVSVAPSRSCGS